jgi:hypothetical protein
MKRTTSKAWKSNTQQIIQEHFTFLFQQFYVGTDSYEHDYRKQADNVDEKSLIFYNCQKQPQEKPFPRGGRAGSLCYKPAKPILNHLDIQ